MQIRIRQRIETKESIIRMDKRMILRMLRRSIYTPATHNRDAPVLVTHHTQTPNRATNTTHNPIFYDDSRGEGVLFQYFSFIFHTIRHFFCVIRRVGRFMFQGQH